MSERALAIGVVAESPEQLHVLSRTVKEAGHSVAASVNASLRVPDVLPQASAWLVQLDEHCDQATELLDRLETEAVPIIYSETGADANQDPDERLRRIAAKLHQLASRSEPQRSAQRAEEAWIIAASAGGPAAVTEFLRALHQIPDGVALLYVQHIGTESSANLKRVVDNNSRWKVYATDQYCVLEEKALYVVSPRYALSFSGDGSIQPSDQSWAGPYSPSVDQMMAKVARQYGARSGAIIFSGMGDDGRRSCAFMHRLGGQIWAQEPSTCAVDSMPTCAIASGCVSFVGNPAQLAQHFAEERLSRQSLYQSG